MTLHQELKNLIERRFPDDLVSKKFCRRLKEGKLTRDENPVTHFCVFFAAFDAGRKQVFVGHHRKADTYLFNGGHIDQGETLRETLEREMREEWGFVHEAAKTLEPSFITIKNIDPSYRFICRRHYDIWYFVPVDKARFSPDESKLMKEFHQMKWVNFAEARKIITDSNTLTAVDAIEKLTTMFLPLAT